MPSPSVTLPFRVVTLPFRFVTLPFRVVTLPFRVVTLPSRFVTLPFRFVTLPFRVVTRPSRFVTLPFRVVTLPFRVVTLPSRVTTRPWHAVTLAWPNKSPLAPESPGSSPFLTPLPSRVMTPPMRPPSSLPPRALLVAALSFSFVSACKGSPPSPSTPTDPDAAAAPVAITPQGKVLQAAENEAPDGGAAAGAKKPAAAAGAKEKIDIPSGGFAVGSTPGDRGRDATLEPALLPIELGGYSIDKYLYPNDPQKAPVTGVTRQRAADLCQEAGGRLCTELEWERACKGPEGSAWPGSATWDAACAKAPLSCASGYGALGMGSALREWTASDVAPIESMVAKGAAVRGAKGDTAGPDHRCAHRSAVEATSSGDDLGFRCCHGAPNAATIPAPQFQQTFRKAEIGPAQVAEMIASVPELKDLSRDITYFKEPDDVNQVLARGDAGVNTVPNTTFTTQPILWSPVPGEEILVIAARAQKSSFIVAFYRLPGDRYRIASSLLLKDEKGPIVLGENSYIRKRIPWGLCWDCRGESGHVTYRDDNRVVITQK